MRQSIGKIGIWVARLAAMLILSICVAEVQAQSPQSGSGVRPRMGVLQLDTRGLAAAESEQALFLTRNELEKLNRFEVIDNYDIDYFLKDKGGIPNNCFGKQCLVETGRLIKADKMLTGTIMAYGDHIAVSFKLINVLEERVEQTTSMDFLNIRGQLPAMLSLTFAKMFDMPLDNDMLNKLTKKFDYESTINNPNVEKLNLSGPRMGFTLVTGANAEVLRAKKSVGGFEGFPLMFQFGYQFEVQYLNEGNFQALFEFIPMVTGLDQGRFVPSFTLLNGLRSNVQGWELAFGPTIQVSRRAKGYLDADNVFIPGDAPANTNFELVERFDSRGLPALESGFVVAAGKSFKSGRLNIPVNVFFVPNKNGHRFGISMGFNARK